MGCSRVLLVLLLAALPAAAEQASAKKPSKLVEGKLVYVAPMPGNLDQWILDNLRRWGKYRVTGDPEGVDLVIEVNAPERETQYDMRGGIPRPRRDDGKSPRPGREPAEPGAISVTVTDWVTRETLWHADLLNRKQKKDEADPPAGPHAKIFARGLTPDQLALKITTKLREYVSGLEKGQAGAPAPRND